MYRSVVFHDAGLLDAFHKFLQLHVFFRQLEALHSAILVPIVVARAFYFLVPLYPTDEALQFWPCGRLWKDLVS